ncbi:MAG TPA: hypothetical protein VFW14_18940 [Gaiellales bacterium]|jgi:hypothetical protein|nr:hypothetical protein [Gaiellales bacterium]
MLQQGHVQRVLGRRRGSRGLGGARATLVPSLPYLVPLAAAVAASLAGFESTSVFAAVAASAVLCAFVRTGVEHERIELRREKADGWLSTRCGEQPDDPMLLARIEELSSPRLRKTLARSFRRVARDVHSFGRPMTPAQHNRRNLRPHAEQIRRLAERLDDRTRPVGPRGMAMAHRLVTMGSGPLYNSRRAQELPAHLNATLGALDETG